MHAKYRNPFLFLGLLLFLPRFAAAGEVADICAPSKAATQEAQQKLKDDHDPDWMIKLHSDAGNCYLTEAEEPFDREAFRLKRILKGEPSSREQEQVAALRHLQKQFDARRKSAEHFFKEGAIQMTLGEYQRAANIFKLASEVNPEEPAYEQAYQEARSKLLAE